MGSKRKRNARDGTNSNHSSQKRAKNSHALPDRVEKESRPELDKSPFTENPTGEALKREARLYELLRSADDNERIEAADAIITGLFAEGVAEAVLERHLEKRLFRGLASSATASRVGYSLVITEILRQLFGEDLNAASRYKGLTFEKVLGILLEKTKPGGNIPGQEERDHYFGQLFGLQCFVEARILLDDKDRKARWAPVLDLLLKLAKKKTWLRAHCGWVIIEAMDQMSKAATIETANKIAEVGLSKTPEGIGIWIKANDDKNVETPAKPWWNPLIPKALPEVANVLKENLKDDREKQDPAAGKVRQTNWTAQLHFVWDIILNHYVNHPKKLSAESLAEQFQLFWTTVVDDGLFSKNASDSQKFRGFTIFQKYIQALSKNELLLSHLFSRNLMKCLLNQAAKEDRYLHRAAVKTLKVIEQVVQSNSSALVPILLQLFGQWGAYNFDQRTNSKTVEKILQYADAEHAHTIIEILKTPVAKPKLEDTREVDGLRQVFAEYLSKLVTQTQTPTESQHAGSTAAELGIKELATCAYSRCGDTFHPELSDKSQTIFRTRLASSLAKLTKRPESFQYLCNLVLQLEPDAIKLDDEIQAERDSAIESLRTLLSVKKKATKEEQASIQGLALLFAVAIIQLYDADPDAVGVLQDLQQCHDKLLVKGKKEAGGASEFLVEILLSLVARPSSLMRQVVQQVFEAFAGQMSTKALELLTYTLAAEENEKGQRALFNIEDEEMEDAHGSDVEVNSGSDDDDDEDEEEDEISEIGSDVEFVTLNGADGAEDDEDGSVEEVEGEDDDDAQAKELADLDDALAKVLKSHRLDKDLDAASSDSDEDMTDSEMMDLDDKLVEVFKQRAKKSNQKKEKKDAKDSVVNFKHRVLDLLAIYVRTEALNPMAFSLLSPLLELIRTTTTKVLGNKASEIISDFLKAFKKARSNSDELASFQKKDQLELLKAIHLEATKDLSHAFARAASTASLLVASSLYAIDRDNIHEVAAVYAQTQAAWALGNIKIQSTFFTEWLNWCSGHASNANAKEQ